jgi:gluconate 2-dehydrogenase gamma chain
MRRREFIVLPAKALGGLVLYSLVGELIPAPAQDGVKVPLRFFTAAEAQVVQAASERIFPSDESGPGATEAGVVIYIDRQLAGPYGRDQRRYTKGPRGGIDSGTWLSRQRYTAADLSRRYRVTRRRLRRSFS